MKILFAILCLSVAGYVGYDVYSKEQVKHDARLAWLLKSYEETAERCDRLYPGVSKDTACAAMRNITLEIAHQR